MKIAYCDCFSGISGDMFLGALIDAGLGLDELKSSLAGLDLEEAYELQAVETHKGAFRATQFRVVMNEQSRHHHVHRHLSDIQVLIESSGLPEPVQQTSLAIFGKLARAEARTHGQPVESVHFHEVGAVDSIVDVIGAALGLHRLGIDKLYASPLPLGGGQGQSAHGVLPFPAPATLELLAAAGAPTRPAPGRGELVTPTGAAILAALAEFSQPEMTLERIGVGSGQKDLPWPNIFRLWVGECPSPPGQSVVVLETNLDDLNPEISGYVMGLLFEAGALDVYYTPIYMKKNRPASILSVIARPEAEAAMAELILRETSTLGLRVQRLHRYEAARRSVSVNTPYGEVQVKQKILGGETAGIAPEYETCARLARQHQVPLAAVYNAAIQAMGSISEGNSLQK
jgi:pyridinium-3,5-bisthiocarboxylic acid mononucleotide nickel chelatase